MYDPQGHIVSSFHAGDGVERIQTTETGRVWVGYFDEGVFSRVKLGQEGLACLDPQGTVLFRHGKLAQTGAVPAIADCYALNVASEEDVWAYYYTDFPVLHLRRGEVAGLWTDIPVTGASAFAVHDGCVLFLGSYKHKRDLHLLTLGERRAARFTPVDEAGEQLGGAHLDGCSRGSKLHIHTGEALYAVDLAELD